MAPFSQKLSTYNMQSLVSQLKKLHVPKRNKTNFIAENIRNVSKYRKKKQLMKKKPIQNKYSEIHLPAKRSARRLSQERVES